MSASERAPHPLVYILFFQKGFSPHTPEQMAGTGPGDREEKETGDAWALGSANKLLMQRVETDYSSEPSGENLFSRSLALLSFYGVLYAGIACKSLVFHEWGGRATEICFLNDSLTSTGIRCSWYCYTGGSKTTKH